MGKFTRWLKDNAPPVEDARFDDVWLFGDRLYKGNRPGTKKALESGDTHPVAGVVCELARGAELKQRVTATRLVTIGVFALAAQKKSGGEWWLLIEGDDFAWTVEVDRKDQAEAREFVTKVKLAAKSAV